MIEAEQRARENAQMGIAPTDPMNNGIQLRDYRTMSRMVWERNLRLKNSFP